LLAKLLEACSNLLEACNKLLLDRREPLVDNIKMPVNIGNKAGADSDDKGVVLRHGSYNWNAMTGNGGVVEVCGRGGVRKGARYAQPWTALTRRADAG